MPYVIGFFLVSTGFLFGFLVRYRDQKDEATIRESLTQENVDLRTSLHLAHNSNNDLEERFVSQQGQLATVKQLCDEWSASRQQMRQEREAMESVLATKSRQIDKQAEAFETEKLSSISLKEQLQKTTKDLELAEAKLVQADSNGTVHPTNSMSSTTARKNTGLKMRLANQESTILRLRSELSESRNRTRELNSKVGELQSTCQRISELNELVQRRDQDEQHFITELKTIREQYAVALQRQQELECQLAGIRDTDATVISFSEAMDQRRRAESDYDEEYGGPTQKHETRGIVYTETPSRVDDLKQISGIADVLEARLNDYGIYTFKQIKAWGPQAIDEFSHLLAFKDRIERDNWIEQATQLYGDKGTDHRTSAA